MNPTELILNPQTGLLRAGWRAAIFIALLNSPYLIYGLLPKNTGPSPVAAIDASLGTILTYAVFVAWVVAWAPGLLALTLGRTPRGGRQV